MIRLRHFVLLTFASVLPAVASCGGEGEGSALPAPGRLAVDPVPLTRIGDTEPGTDSVILQYARWATRLPDGVVAVADQYRAAIHLFGADGTRIRTVGRRGEGPGEYSDPTFIGTCGTDSLFVWDTVRRRMTVLDRQGEYARHFGIEEWASPVGCSGGGWVAFQGIPEEFVPISDDGSRSTVSLGAADMEGRVTGSFGPFPAWENRGLGKVVKWAGGADRLYVGTADSAWVDVLALDGTPLGAVPIGDPDQRPTARNWEAAIERMISVSRRAEIIDHFRQQYRAVPPPETAPPYQELRTDPDDALWAVVSLPGDPGTRIQATAKDGTDLGEVTLPPGFELFEVGRDYLLGVLENDLGRQQVVVYRLRRG